MYIYAGRTIYVPQYVYIYAHLYALIYVDNTAGEDAIAKAWDNCSKPNIRNQPNVSDHMLSYQSPQVMLYADVIVHKLLTQNGNKYF